MTDIATAVTALHHYRNTAAPADADRAAADQAIATVAASTGMTYHEAVRDITNRVLRQERADRQAAMEEALERDRATAALTDDDYAAMDEHAAEVGYERHLEGQGFDEAQWEADRERESDWAAWHSQDA
jgi:ABC-type amino acid transport substrate-binding protein